MGGDKRILPVRRIGMGEIDDLDAQVIIGQTFPAIMLAALE